MAATMIWANDNNNQLVHIRKVSKDVKCTCVECGEPLIQCKGKKNDWYFRHDNQLSECKGYTNESMLHKLAKELVATKVDKIVVADHYIKLNDEKKCIDEMHTTYNLANTKGQMEKELPIVGVRPDVLYVFEGEHHPTEYLSIELYVTHKKSEEDIEKYIKTAYEYCRNWTGTNFYTIEVDLRSLIPHVSDDDIEDKILKLLCDGEHVYYIYTFNLISHRKALEKAIHKNFGKIGICPFQNNDIILTKNCKVCPMYKDTQNGVCTCYGNGGVYDKCSLDIWSYNVALWKSNLDDVKNDSEYKVPDMPESIYSTVSRDNKEELNYLGICPVCGQEYRFCVGSDSMKYPNIGKLRSQDGTGVYLSCLCGLHEVRCPSCKGSMHVSQNRSTDAIFVSCDNWKKYPDSPKPPCGWTFTVFEKRGKSTKLKVSGEVAAMGNLGELKNNPKAVLERLEYFNRDVENG